MKQQLGALLALLALTSACSSSGSPSISATRSQSPTASKSYTPLVGADASEIASHIPGCSTAVAASTGAGGPTLTTAATCTLQRHIVIIDGFATAADATISAALKPKNTYYAHGASWVAFLADDGATAATTTLQMQLTNDAAGLTKQALSQSAKPRPLASIQQALTSKIANALGGTVSRAGT